nr:sigma 54-interacting transcriptional regulator [Flavobacteriaceae bacterium]
MDKELLPTEINHWLLENLPYKMMWMDEFGTIVYGNKVFCERLGYKKSELTKLTVFDINPSSTKESWESHWLEVKKKKVVNFKSVHQTKDGKFYDVEVFAQFFSNNGKNLICAVVNEITESSFYKNLLNHAERMASVGGWKLNLQDGSLIVTEQALCIFNTNDKHDLLPGNVIHLFQEPDTIKRLLSEVIRKGREYDEIFLLKNGRYVRGVTRAEIKKNKVYKIIGTYQDVTEQVEKENSLNFFKEVIDNAHDLIYVLDREGNLIHYSRSLINKLGFSKEELDTFNVYDLDPKITTDWWHNHFDEIVKNGSVHLEWSEMRKDGSEFPVDVTANHLRYNGKDLNCAIIRDVTERKIQDEKLKVAFEEISLLKSKLEEENEYLQEEISSKINFDDIVCQSVAYRKVLEQVTQVAVTDATVLITGESGTGKELLANAVHLNSARKDNILIKVNCAALPKELIESELFGHKKGAFTGAIADKLGKFSLADGGTIFLDEIGEVPIDLQAKLLRVLQEGEFDQLGNTAITKVDVRIIAATNRDLQEMVKKGTFREDLYYRLNVFPIENIPLRARKEDIPLLAQFFLDKYSTKAGKAFRRLSKKTISRLMDYNFPGNIRELENLIERAVI